MSESSSSSQNERKAKSTSLSLEFPAFEVRDPPCGADSPLSMIQLSELYLRAQVLRADFEETRLRQKCVGVFEL